MIEPLDWIPFMTEEEQLNYLKAHGLTPETSTTPKLLYYTGFYDKRIIPCNVVGYVDAYTTVIEIDKGRHCIHPDALLEKQSEIANLSDGEPYEYVVLDLETTGFSAENDEIIEIAAQKYINGKKTDEFSSLVSPTSDIQLNITILTGITNAMVNGYPTIDEILPSFLDFIGLTPIVGHNIAFDMRFLQKAAGSINRELENKTYDTLKLARTAYPNKKSYKLSNLKESLNIEVSESHRAMPDVEVTAQLFKHCINKISLGVEPIHDSSSPAPKKKKTSKYIKISDLHTTKESFDTNHPLYKKILVFTGELSIGRVEAMQATLDLGGIVKSAVSSKTNFLVVGEQSSHLIGADGLSSKERKARELIDTGKSQIKIITEREFLSLVGSWN